jgi:hypothetical protein
MSFMRPLDVNTIGIIAGACSVYDYYSGASLGIVSKVSLFLKNIILTR